MTRLFCPIHGMPDCSPLLNGCNVLTWADGVVHDTLREAADEIRSGMGYHDARDLDEAHYWLLERAGATEAEETKPPRVGFLMRRYDHTGVSGTGQVAEVAEFADGTAVVRWHGEHASTVVWASVDDALAIHGHQGDTTVAWL